MPERNEITVMPVTYLIGPDREPLEEHAAFYSDRLTEILTSPEEVRVHDIFKGQRVILCGLTERILSVQDKSPWAVTLQAAVADHGIIDFAVCHHDVWAAARARVAGNA